MKPPSAPRKTVEVGVEVGVVVVVGDVVPVVVGVDVPDVVVVGDVVPVVLVVGVVEGVVVGEVVGVVVAVRHVVVVVVLVVERKFLLYNANSRDGSTLFSFTKLSFAAEAKSRPAYTLHLRVADENAIATQSPASGLVSPVDGCAPVPQIRKLSPAAVPLAPPTLKK